jgi:hypothetical protein
MDCEKSVIIAARCHKYIEGSASHVKTLPKLAESLKTAHFEG